MGLLAASLQLKEWWLNHSEATMGMSRRNCPVDCKPTECGCRRQIHLNDIGAGTLIPLQKPGKPRGPLSNLRPVVLLNGIRKVLSLILLKRFSPYTNSYIPATQAGFRKGHSCADIIFAKRMICSMALLTDMEFHFLCLDLSRAFDTPSRETILESLLTATGEDEDVYIPDSPHFTS